ncbi:CXXC-type zinc finger protein 1-like [Phocoena sinus]|uniref:CXXC-type zinc finger protein 1-like n=1 Tax=Phocoena sinus TaxID=42100 RepID=UPI0013C4529C|nr:CXXC-type zinc finger protein 1-like [Phocoena sinus]
MTEYGHFGVSRTWLKYFLVLLLASSVTLGNRLHLTVLQLLLLSNGPNDDHCQQECHRNVLSALLEEVRDVDVNLDHLVKRLPGAEVSCEGIEDGGAGDGVVQGDLGVDNGCLWSQYGDLFEFELSAQIIIFCLLILSAETTDGLQPWMNDTEDFPFLDSALQKQAMDTKKRKNLKKKVEWKKEKQQKLMEKSEDPEQSDAEHPASLRQCLGPGCVHPTRPGSKYCSDDCGMKLAADRIYAILPKRIQQWQKSPCVAEEHGKKMLERIHREQQDTHTRLKDIECHFHELEAIIQRGKQQPVCKDEESDKRGRNSINLQIFCVSCGQPIKMQVALRHMEHCFAKYERKSPFTSMYPTRIEGATRLFCDVYDPWSKSYCKRLQVLCPEHSKDPKVLDEEVCGCPLVKNVFEPTDNFCCLPKRLCSHHYCWEKLRRAEVDLERVRMLLKLEELVEQEHKVRTAMKNRAGLLALMLHQTIQHDPLTTDLRSRVDS